MSEQMTTQEKALALHKEWNGKLETISKTPVKSREALSLAYTPGVAEPCKVIAKDKEAAYQYTMKANTVAVVSDGSAVLGLGNIGPYAAMPVMEGKAVLFKEFGGVNAVPICLDTQDTEEIIKAVTWLAPAYGGINLEDISAPRCFEIEERLKAALDIPVFHDDQHGTAIVVLAGIINALKVVGKQKEACKVVVNGAGSAGVAITKLLLTYGFTNVILCDKVGIISTPTEGLNWMQDNPRIDRLILIVFQAGIGEGRRQLCIMPQQLVTVLLKILRGKGQQHRPQNNQAQQDNG